MTLAQLRRLEHDLGELVERHDTERDLSEFKRYANDPLGFIREVLKGDPWSRQAEIAEAVKNDPLVVVRSCNAAGKDWIAAQLALWWVYARQGRVLLTGPTERQVREIVMAEVTRAFARASDLPGELFQMALRLGPGEQAGILAFTSTEASRLTGFHAPRVMAVITEAQGVEDFCWEGLLACATGAEDRVLAVGNPLSPSGRFYAVNRPQSGWHAIKISGEEHPNIVEGRTVIPGGPSPEFAKRIEQEYGRSSGIYTARVLGEFPDQGEEGLFRRIWLEAAAERCVEYRRKYAGEQAVVAVDPARYGPDETVVAIRRGPVITEIVSWCQVDLMETVERLRVILDRVGISPGDSPSPPRGTVSATWASRGRSTRSCGQGRVVVDEVGLGGGVADRLRELGYQVEGFNGGSKAKDAERFMNRRAESYWQLRKRLEEGRVALPADEQLFDELMALRWRPTAEGKVRLEAKEELKSRLGQSPDRADAVVMCMYEKLRKGVSATWGKSNRVAAL